MNTKQWSKIFKTWGCQLGPRACFLSNLKRQVAWITVTVCFYKYRLIATTNRFNLMFQDTKSDPTEAVVLRPYVIKGTFWNQRLRMRCCNMFMHCRYDLVSESRLQKWRPRPVSVGKTEPHAPPTWLNMFNTWW